MVEESTEEKDSAVSGRPLSAFDFLLALGATVAMTVWGAPKLLSRVADARVIAMVGFIADTKAGLARYQSNVGSILPLDPSGSPAPQPLRSIADPWSTGWVLTRSIPPSAKGMWDRFQGPYLRIARLESPPMGSNPRLGTGWVGLGTRQVPASPSFDLAGVGASTIPSGKAVAWLVVTGVKREDFEALDTRLDGGMGGTFEKRCRQGEVQWNSDAEGTLRIHLLHQ